MTLIPNNSSNKYIHWTLMQVLPHSKKWYKHTPEPVLFVHTDRKRNVNQPDMQTCHAPCLMSLYLLIKIFH